VGARVSLVSDIPAGEGKIDFYKVFFSYVVVMGQQEGLDMPQGVKRYLPLYCSKDRVKRCAW
jgi:hypothetical protein